MESKLSHEQLVAIESEEKFLAWAQTSPKDRNVSPTYRGGGATWKFEDYSNEKNHKPTASIFSKNFRDLLIRLIKDENNS